MRVEMCATQAHQGDRRRGAPETSPATRSSRMGESAVTEMAGMGCMVGEVMPRRARRRVLVAPGTPA